MKKPPLEYAHGTWIRSSYHYELCPLNILLFKAGLNTVLVHVNLRRYIVGNRRFICLTLLTGPFDVHIGRLITWRNLSLVTNKT